MYAFAFAQLLNEADAEDVTQEAFLYAYERLGQLRSPDRFSAWISRIARSYAHRRHRRRKRETVVDVHTSMRDIPGVANEQESFERREDAWKILTQALPTLSDTLRTPFLMRHLADAPYKLIGETLLITPSAAERRVRKARTQLRKYLESRGLSELARDAVLSSGVVSVVGAPASGAVGEQIRDMPRPGRAEGGAASHGALPLASAGTAIGLMVLVGFGGVKHWLGGDVTTQEVAVMPVHVAPSVGAPTWGYAPARLPEAFEAPVGARLIASDSLDDLGHGQALPSWTSGAHMDRAALGPDGQPGVGVISTNIPCAYYRFPLVQGRVTVEMWMKPHPGPDANWALRIGNDLAGWRIHDDWRSEWWDGSDALNQKDLFSKSDSGLLQYWADGTSMGRNADIAMPAAAYDGEWHHVRTVYDTSLNAYDIHLDHQLLARRVPSLVDFTAGISLISLNSGRWEREQDHESYFDHLRIYVQPFDDAGT